LHDSVDFVTTVPPSSLNFVHVGKLIEIEANSKYFGNPNPIAGISFVGDSEMKNSQLERFLIHFQQVYMDGILYGETIFKNLKIDFGKIELKK
jgi:hypothetical protein